MKNLKVLFSSILLFFSIGAFSQSSEKYISSNSYIKFFSTTPVEDIEAKNFATVSTLNSKTGEVVFSVPMQSFEFEKALMQKHFNNEHFLETSTYPKSKLKGVITNIGEIYFLKDGKYPASFEGTITIKGKTKNLKEEGAITVTGNVLDLSAEFDLVLADFGIMFDEGEKVSKKIGKSVKVTVNTEYTIQ